VPTASSPSGNRTTTQRCPSYRRRSSLGRELDDQSLVALVDIALVMVHGGLGDEAGARAAGWEAVR
jgi:hypothetical protein